MHELSLCHAIAGVVKPYAAGRRVDVVRVQIGALRQVVPDSLSFCWTLVRDDESMPEAELELEFVAARWTATAAESIRRSPPDGACAARAARAPTWRSFGATSSWSPHWT